MIDAGLDAEAVRLVIRQRVCCQAGIMRVFNIGYRHAGELMARMEAERIVGPADEDNRRPILIPERLN